jgi:hypothetical protein
VSGFTSTVVSGFSRTADLHILAQHGDNARSDKTLSRRARSAAGWHALGYIDL